MDIARKARHLGVVGRSGTGKTTWGISYILGGPHGRVIVADHEGEFAHRLKLPLAGSWEEVFAQCERQRVICVDIGELSPGDSESAFDELSRVTLELAKQYFQPRGLETLFVIDEVQKYTSTASIPAHFKTLVETGRKWGVDTLSLSQRPNRIHGDMKEQFTEMLFFKMQDPNSHKFGEYFGLTADEQTALPDGAYLYMNMKTGEQRRGKLF